MGWHGGARALSATMEVRQGWPTLRHVPSPTVLRDHGVAYDHSSNGRRCRFEIVDGFSPPRPLGREEPSELELAESPLRDPSTRDEAVAMPSSVAEIRGHETSSSSVTFTSGYGGRSFIRSLLGSPRAARSRQPRNRRRRVSTVAGGMSTRRAKTSTSARSSGGARLRLLQRLLYFSAADLLASPRGFEPRLPP